MLRMIMESLVDVSALEVEIFGSEYWRKKTNVEIMSVKDGCIGEIYRRKQTRFSQINTWMYMLDLLIYTSMKEDMLWKINRQKSQYWPEPHISFGWLAI